MDGEDYVISSDYFQDINPVRQSSLVADDFTETTKIVKDNIVGLYADRMKLFECCYCYQRELKKVLKILIKLLNTER